MWHKKMRHLPLRKIIYFNLQTATDKEKVRVDGEVPSQEKVASPAGATTIKNPPVNALNGGEGKWRAHVRNYENKKKKWCGFKSSLSRGAKCAVGE